MTRALIDALDAESRIAARSLASVAPLSDEAFSTLSGQENLRTFIDVLLARGLSSDALHCLARALPRQYALGWACGCVKKMVAGGGKLLDVDRVGLALAERCLVDDSVDSRASAGAYAERDGYTSTGGWLAAAAAWTGGSLLPEEFDAVPPPEHLTSEAVAAALLTLATQTEAQEAAIVEFVQQGLRAFGGSQISGSGPS